MFILDTNLVTELRKIRGGSADPHVTRWADSVDAATLFISVVTIMELEVGVLRIERRDARQGVMLRNWFENHVIPEFAGRTLAIDVVVARRCAALHVPDPRSERDALIAATALVHGMVVATRNTDDFAATGVALFNPWTPQA